MKPYIYIALRSDLSRPQQAVQASHAAIESARNFINEGMEHPSVIILNMKSEEALIKFNNSCPNRTIGFREPDIGNQLTAIATEPVFGDDRKYFRKYQLLK